MLRSVGPNRECMSQPNRRTSPGDITSLRSSQTTLDREGKDHLPHHPGTVAQNPWRKALGLKWKCLEWSHHNVVEWNVNLIGQKKKSLDDSILYRGLPNSEGLYLSPHLPSYFLSVPQVLRKLLLPLTRRKGFLVFPSGLDCITPTHIELDVTVPALSFAALFGKR